MTNSLRNNSARAWTSARSWLNTTWDTPERSRRWMKINPPRSRPPVDPTHQDDPLANVTRTQVTAAMGSFEATEEVQRDGGLTCGVHQRSCGSWLYVRLSST